MVKGEVDYRDLPPVEEVAEVCPPAASLSAVGQISHMAEKLIIIASNDNTPPLDEGSVFWTADRIPIGKLFETFGPVKSPYYSVRATEPIHPCTSPGTHVFVILGTSEMTKYVFTDQLLKGKGSDASWLNDNEVPDGLQEFSDDEQEQAAHKRKKKSPGNASHQQGTTHGRTSKQPPARPRKSHAPTRSRNSSHPPPPPPSQHGMFSHNMGGLTMPTPRPHAVQSFSGTSNPYHCPPLFVPMHPPPPPHPHFPPPLPLLSNNQFPPPLSAAYPMRPQHPPPQPYSWQFPSTGPNVMPPPPHLLPSSLWCPPGHPSFHGLPPNFP